MYEKQTWKNGDVITENKLNHIEDGIIQNMPNVYCVPGDYGVEDIIDEEYLNNVNYVLDNGGVAFINVYGNDIRSTFYYLTYSIGCKSFNGQYELEFNFNTGEIVGITDTIYD